MGAAFKPEAGWLILQSLLRKKYILPNHLEDEKGGGTEGGGRLER